MVTITIDPLTHDPARLDATLTAATHGELSRGNGQDQGASPRQLRAKKHGRTAAAVSRIGWVL